MNGYRTIVADPPWHYDSWPTDSTSERSAFRRPGATIDTRRRSPLPYPSLTVGEIAELPVGDLAERDAHLYLWTTQRYLGDSFGIVKSWGFRYAATLIWSKSPRGLGPGGTYMPTAEFVIFARRGTCKALSRIDRCVWEWPRGEHSRKPEAFLDLVEQVSPGPYLEMFARRQRLGWDTWGNEALEHVSLAAVRQEKP
jgi:N6-adenosine-specific RNA methylase IME4